MSNETTPTTAVRPLVPDGPLVPNGSTEWWWRDDGEDTVPVSVRAVKGALAWDDPGGSDYGWVTDDGHWRGPCLSLADVEAARREERERWAKRLDSMVRGAEQPGYVPAVWSDTLRRLAAEMRGVK